MRLPLLLLGCCGMVTQCTQAALQNATSSRGITTVPSNVATTLPPNASDSTKEENPNDKETEKKGPFRPSLVSNFFRRMADAGKPTNYTSAQCLLNFINKMPGLFQGLGDFSQVSRDSGNGSDVANLLTWLFGSPEIAVLPPPSTASMTLSTTTSSLKKVPMKSGDQARVSSSLPNVQCRRDLHAFASGLLARDFWALKMLDSVGKPASGIFNGDNFLFGNYGECVSVSQSVDNRTIRGQLCGMNLKTPDLLNVQFSGLPLLVHACVPKTCREKDIHALFQPMTKSLETEILSVDCQYQRADPRGDNIYLGVMITLCLLTALCAAGTGLGVFLDLYEPCRQHNRQNEHPPPISLTPSGGHANSAYDGNGEDHGSHLTGKLTNQEAADIIRGVQMNVAKRVGCQIAAEDGNVCSQEEMRDAEKEEVKEDVVPASQIEPDRDWRKMLPCQLLLTFSVLRNGRKLLNCSGSGSDVACLHGIRVMSTLWIVLGHVFAMAASIHMDHEFIKQYMNTITYQAIPALVLAVDTFFLLSGFLGSYLFLRKCEKTGLTVRDNVIYFFHRYWRLTPLYALLLAVYMGVFPYLKEGPFRNHFGMDSQGTCRQTWINNIFYTNTLTGEFGKGCFMVSWYLADDMIFSYLGRFILLPLALTGRFQSRGRAVGISVAVFLILLQIVLSGSLSYIYEACMYKNMRFYMRYIYAAPWCRAGPYAVGLILGYILCKTKCKYSMKKGTVLIGWTVAWVMGLLLVYIRYDNIRNLSLGGPGWNAGQWAAFISLAKVAWSLCVAWVIFACVTGHGGFVNSLLSWSAWRALSKLSYGVYLIHMIVIYVLSGNWKFPVHLDSYSGTELTVAVMVISFLAAFVFSLLIEMPCQELETTVLGKIFPPVNKQKTKSKEQSKAGQQSEMPKSECRI